jgi:hypothetical protein
LPIAPYIEHGSWVTGYPSIMRYGRDPYRGLGQPSAEDVTAIISETVRETVAPALMIGSGAVVGAAAGIAGSLLRRPVLGALIGAVGGGLLGYLAHSKFSAAAAPRTSTEGLNGVLAVL